MKILAFIIPALLGLAAGAVMFFLLLLGLNGYSEEQSAPGLILFLVWVLLGAIAAGFLSLVGTSYLTDKKSWGVAKAALLATLVLTVAAVIFSVAGAFAAVLMIEALR
jgi:hypothetical protein